MQETNASQNDADRGEPSRPELLPVWAKLQNLVVEVVDHSGYGEVHVSVRWLSKGRKEIILASGKEYRFVIPAKADLRES